MWAICCGDVRGEVGTRSRICLLYPPHLLPPHSIQPANVEYSCLLSFFNLNLKMAI